MDLRKGVKLSHFLCGALLWAVSAVITPAHAQVCDAGTAAVSSTSICVGTAPTFTTTGNTGTPTWYAHDQFSTTWQMIGTGTPYTPAPASSPGTYTIIAVVSDGICTPDTSNSLTVVINPNPTVNLGADATVCGSTVLNAGNAGATYVWSTGATTQSITATSTGTYSVTVTANGCQGTDAIDVTVNPLSNAGTASVTSTSICVGGTAPTFTATGANAPITWIAFDPIANDWDTIGAGSPYTPSSPPSSPGTYTIIAVSNNGLCPTDTSNSLTIVIKPIPTVNLGADAAACGSMALNAGNAGSTYAWSTGATTQGITATSTGTYSVTVTANGCQGTDAIDVTINPLSNAGAASVSSSQICVGGTATYTSTGSNATPTWIAFDPSTNDWDTIGMGTSLTPSPASFPGTYTIIAVSNNGLCPNDTSNSLTVTINTPPTVNLGADAAACGSMVLNAGNAGATYVWSTGATTQSITATSTGTYSVTVTANGCQGTDAINVTVNTVPEAGTAAVTATSICVGGTAPTFTTTGNNLSPTWIAFDPIANDWDTIGMGSPYTPNNPPSFPGTYTIIAVASNGLCPNDTSNSLTIVINPNPTVNLGADITVCGSTVLNAGNTGSTYAWSTGATTQSISATATGTYSVTVTMNGCQGTDAIDVTINPLSNAGTASVSATQICVGGTATFTSTGSNATPTWIAFDPSTNDWDTIGMGTSLTPSPASFPGTYTVIAVSNNGLCPNDTSNSLTVTINTPPTVNLGADMTVCGSALLDAGITGATYLWNDNSTAQTLTATATGTYSVTVTSGGCQASDAIDVTINPLSDAGAASVSATQICVGGTATFTSTGSNATPTWIAFDPSTNDWDTIGMGTSLTPSPASFPGTYTIIAVSNNGLCPNDTSNVLTVTINTPPTVNLGADMTVCGSALLDAGITGATYLWNDNSTAQTLTATATGTYSVTVTSGGCQASDAIDVTVNALPAVTLSSFGMVCMDNSPFALAGGMPAGGTYSGTGVTAGSFDPMGAGLGTYTITYTVTDPNTTCTNFASQAITVDACTGISAIAGDKNITAYPNPSSGVITISSDWIDSSVLEVYNVLQQKLISTEVTGSAATVDLSASGPGVYMLHFKKGNETAIKKVVIE
jgi:hypothetical protein